MKNKIYGTICFTEEELQLLRGSVSQARNRCFEKRGRGGISGPEKSFYCNLVTQYDLLAAKLEKPFEDDTSQDGESKFE